MNLTEYVTNVRLDLNAPAGISERFSDDEIKRSLQRAIYDLSVRLPRERIYEARVEADTITQTFTWDTDASETIDSTLTYQFVKKGSLTAVNTTAVATFAENTDYTVDYSNGTITWITTAPTTADTITVTYKLSRIVIDLSDLSTLIRPTIVELVGHVPQKFLDWQMFGDYLYITTYDGTTQRELSNNDHVAVYYEALHDSPTATSSGTIRPDLDEVLTKGADGYCLMIRVNELLFESKDASTSADTELDSMDAAQALAVAALSDADSELDDAITAMANLNDQLLGLSNSADADLDGIAAVLTAVDSDLSSVGTHLSSAASALSNVGGRITAATTEFTNAATHASSAATALSTAGTYAGNHTSHISSSSQKLNSGEALINSVNTGLDPAGQYGQYAAVAKTWGDLTNGASATMARVGEVYAALTQARVQAGLGQIGAAEARVGEGNGYGNLAAARNQLAATRLAKARILVDSANARTNIAGALAREAEARVTAALGFVQLAAQYVNLVAQYVTAATGYLNIAVETRNQAEAFRVEAQSFLADFNRLLEDKAVMRRERSLVAHRQAA